MKIHKIKIVAKINSIVQKLVKAANNSELQHSPMRNLKFAGRKSDKQADIKKSLDKKSTNEKIELAKKTNDIDVLNCLIKDKSTLVRTAILENKKATPDMFVELSSDPYEHVRWSVAKNPKSPEKALKRLAGDAEIEIRQAVALNPGITATVLNYLSRDKHWQVLVSLAENELTPINILKRLKSRKIAEVTEAVENNPNWNL